MLSIVHDGTQRALQMSPRDVDPIQEEEWYTALTPPARRAKDETRNPSSLSAMRLLTV